MGDEKADAAKAQRLRDLALDLEQLDCKLHPDLERAQRLFARRLASIRGGAGTDEAIERMLDDALLSICERGARRVSIAHAIRRLKEEMAAAAGVKPDGPEKGASAGAA